MKKIAMKKESFIIWGKVLGMAAVSAIVCMVLLFLTGLIPQSAITQSCLESGEYFKDHELFPLLVEDQFNTRQDNYADCILVNIMYHISGDDLAGSLIRASYYNPEMESVEVSLWDSLKEEKEPNIDYFRYWHGGMVLLRPLFVFTGIEGARLILGVVLLLLTPAVFLLLWRQKAKALSVCYLLGNLIVQVWMCVFCVEYITTFLVMNVISIISVFLFKGRKNTERLYRSVFLLMAASGVFTCFFDFLTTETLTVTVPLLILLVLRYEAGEIESFRKETGRMAVCGVIWGASYGFMFVLKWLLAVGTLGWQAFGSALESAEYRISGTVYLGNTNMDPEASGFQRFTGAIFRNQGCLFPFREEMQMGVVFWICIGVLFMCIAVIYMLRAKNFSWKMISLCLLLGFVPYLRYMALQSHAYQHYFFTYRAQLVTVTALFYITYEFGLKNLIKGKKT